MPVVLTLCVDRRDRGPISLVEGSREHCTACARRNAASEKYIALILPTLLNPDIHTTFRQIWGYTFRKELILINNFALEEETMR